MIIYYRNLLCVRNKKRITALIVGCGMRKLLPAGLIMIRIFFFFNNLFFYFCRRDKH